MSTTPSNNVDKKRRSYNTNGAMDAYDDDLPRPRRDDRGLPPLASLPLRPASPTRHKNQQDESLLSRFKKEVVVLCSHRQQQQQQQHPDDEEEDDHFDDQEYEQYNTTMQPQIEEDQEEEEEEEEEEEDLDCFIPGPAGYDVLALGPPTDEAWYNGRPTPTSDHSTPRVVETTTKRYPQVVDITTNDEPQQVLPNAFQDSVAQMRQKHKRDDKQDKLYFDPFREDKVEKGVNSSSSSSLVDDDDFDPFYDEECDKQGMVHDDDDCFDPFESSDQGPLPGAFPIQGPSFRRNQQDLEQGTSVSSSLTITTPPAAESSSSMAINHNGNKSRDTTTAEHQGSLVQAVVVTVHDAMEVQQFNDEEEDSSRRPPRRWTDLARCLLCLALMIALTGLIVAIVTGGFGNVNDGAESFKGSPKPSNPTTMPPTPTPSATSWPDCFNSTNDIFQVVQDKNGPAFPVIVLCPHTVFDIGVWNADTGDYENGTRPLALRSHVNYLCGQDGALANNCSLRGGNVQVYSDASVFGKQQHSNVVVQGMKFQGAATGQVARLSTGGDVTFRACKFQDINLQQGHPMISMDDSNRGDEDDHLTVTFETVLFSGIRQLANKSLNQTMAAIIDAGGAGNSLEIHGCHFTNILFESVGSYAISSSGAELTILDSCFKDSNFQDTSPVRILLGTKLNSVNNYAPNVYNGCLGEFYDPKTAAMNGCFEPDEQNTCGGGKITCDVEFELTPPEPPEVPDTTKPVCLQPPSSMQVTFLGGNCSQSTLCTPPNTTSCSDLNGVPATTQSGSDPAHILAYNEIQVLFRGLVAQGETFELSSKDGVLGSNVTIDIFPPDEPWDDDTILQRINFDASCSVSESMCYSLYGLFAVLSFTDDLSGDVPCASVVPYNPQVSLAVKLPPQETGVEVVSAYLETNYTWPKVVALEDLQKRVLDSTSGIEILIDANIHPYIAAGYYSRLKIRSKTVEFDVTCLFDEEFVFTTQGQAATEYYESLLGHGCPEWRR